MKRRVGCTPSHSWSTQGSLCPHIVFACFPTPRVVPHMGPLFGPTVSRPVLLVVVHFLAPPSPRERGGDMALSVVGVGVVVAGSRSRSRWCGSSRWGHGVVDAGGGRGRGRVAVVV